MSQKKDVSPWNPSERATLRVKNPIPAPDVCRYCGGDVSIINNKEIYGRSFGDWPWAYRCGECGAYVGMHPFTNIPLGTLADAKLRNARNACKAPFNLIWESGVVTRSEAYRQLAEHMGIDPEKCHFGWFDVAQCETAKAWALARIGGGLA